MADIGISITKRVPFRGATQEFSNVYHYRRLGPMPPTAVIDAIVDELVAAEKSFHSTLVTFMRARAWSSGGTPQQNVTLVEKLLSGTGTEATSTAMDSERAVLIMWRAGIDNRGRQVYLRKWYHCYGNFAGVVFSNAVLQNAVGLSTTDRNTIAAEADQVTRLGAVGEEWDLIAESGREREALLAPIAHQFLEHHQLGDQWRG